MDFSMCSYSYPFRIKCCSCTLGIKCSNLFTKFNALLVYVNHIATEPSPYKRKKHPQKNPAHPQPYLPYSYTVIYTQITHFRSKGEFRIIQ